MSCTLQGPKIYCKMRKLPKNSVPQNKSDFDAFFAAQLTKAQQLQIKGKDGIIVTDDLVIG